MAMVKELQPSTLIFSDAGPDIRWIGNERGFAGETNWSTIDARDIVIGDADVEYLNTGDPAGEDWVVPLCDTSIRPGWFYHPDQDERVKTAEELVDLYYRSVGRNCVLLLNVPPDRTGRFHENDIRSLREFRRILDETFSDDLAEGMQASASSWRMGHRKFGPGNVVDGDPDSYWAAEEGVVRAEVEILLAEETELDRILLQEPIRFGQRVSSFSVEARVQGEWTEISQGTTIGYKRLLRVAPVRGDGIRIVIDGALAPPALATVGVYKASADEPSGIGATPRTPSTTPPAGSPPGGPGAG
jgi:alpha-L-fucosidase